MNRITIVQSIIKKINAKNYLEIGVSFGDTFLTIDASRKIAVDPKNRLREHQFPRNFSGLSLELKKAFRCIRRLLGLEEAFFFEQTSDAFFRERSDIFARHKIDVALIDGLHTYAQVLKDTENCLKHLSPGGVIVLHDCNPTTPAMAVPANSVEDAASKKIPGWDYLWCGDVWKAILHLRSQHSDLNVFVLDCDMGVGIVTRGQAQVPFSMPVEEVQKLTYQDLETNRESFLNLKPTAYFEGFLTTLTRIGE